LSGANGSQAPSDAEARADAYLSKPVPAEELADCLERLLA
jgi:CheY-like chemotaxis protein